MNNGLWEIVNIPDKHPITPDDTVDVLASIIDPKHANTLIRHLGKIAPLKHLRHVKRVQKKNVEGGAIQLSLLLCLVCEDGNGIPYDVQELISSYKLTVFITKVCKYAATTKEEWEQQCRLWPTSYHPPSYNIEGITGFSEEDSQSIIHFSKVALEMAIIDDGLVCNVAVIVNPLTMDIIAIERDQVTNNAQLRNDVLHSDGSLNELNGSYTSVCCLEPWGWTRRKMNKNPCYWHPLKHAAMVAIESSAVRDMHLFPSLSRVEEKFGEAPVGGLHNSTVRPYLCTGFDIYLVWEPCAMCAMALVHQRIKRIFFVFPNPNNGALGSVYRLQGEKNLNHHYTVFRVLVPDKALDIVEAR